MALQKAGFKTILQEDWFKRVWIIQEVANAKRARVQCGDLSVPTQVFQLAPELLSIRIEPHCKSILDVMPGKRRGTSWWIESRDLYSLLKHFRGSEALDSRDMIFALLGIASDLGENKHIIADYTKSAKDITGDIIRHLYHVDLNLEFRGIKDFLYALESLNTDALISLISSTAGLDKMSESIIRILQRGKDVYISQAVTGAAAQNMRNGEAIMSILFDHAKTNIPVTAEVVAAATANHTQGKEIVTNIPVTAEVVADATANNTQGKEIVGFLFKHAKTEVPITAEVVTAAASNRMHGREIMSFLFQHAKKKIPITAGVVTAAAANGIQGKEIMTLLFQHAKQEIPITDTVVAAAAANSIQGKEIMSTIFENLKNRLLTTSEVGAATAVSSSAFTPKFRLHERC
ncbi:ankyrin repeat and SAM domain containing protein 6, partial [Metarhizium majus ARSEF 297]